MRRRALLASPALLLARPSAAQERTLQITAPWEVTSLDPSRAGYIFTRLSVAETLLGADAGGLPVPQLARAWSVSEDRLTWTFRLRPDARFHDGTTLDPAHVVAALERARALPGVLRNAPIAAIQAGDGGVVIRTDRPFVALPAFLAHSSTQVLAPASFDGASTVAVIGSGPFRVVRAEPPQKIEIAAFDGHDGAKPAVRAANYLAAGRGETRALMAESGQADLTFTLDPASLERLRRSPRLSVMQVPIPRTVTMKFNCGHPALADAAARRAISAAIDRAGMARAILRNPSGAATQLFPPSLAEWHVPGLPPLARGDQKFALTLRTYPDRPELPLLAAAIQDQLRDIGIRIEVAIGNSGDIPGGHRDGTLHLALLARNFSLVPDPIGTMLQDFGPEGGDWGAMGWRNPAMQTALDALSGATDPAERARLRGEVATILHTELPVLPITWYDHTLAVNRRVAGVVLDPLELSYHLPALRWA